MSTIDPTTVDVDDVIRRIQAVRRGELPQDAVSTEELRAAVEAQRLVFSTSGQREAAPEKKTVSGKRLILPGLDDLLG